MPLFGLRGIVNLSGFYVSWNPDLVAQLRPQLKREEAMLRTKLIRQLGPAQTLGLGLLLRLREICRLGLLGFCRPSTVRSAGQTSGVISIAHMPASCAAH